MITKQIPWSRTHLDCTPSSWFSSFSCFVWFSLHFLFFIVYFIPCTFTFHISYTISSLTKCKLVFFCFFFIYDLLLNRKSSGGFFKSVGKFHYINKNASLGFFFICDLLLNSKSYGILFFKSVGKFHFINKTILWKLYVDFSMLASSIGKDINWQ